VRKGERVSKEEDRKTGDGLEGCPKRGEREDGISEGRNGKEPFWKITLSTASEEWDGRKGWISGGGVPRWKDD
jgi:hypothetical protein